MLNERSVFGVVHDQMNLIDFPENLVKLDYVITDVELPHKLDLSHYLSHRLFSFDLKGFDSKLLSWIVTAEI